MQKAWIHSNYPANARRSIQWMNKSLDYVKYFDNTIRSVLVYAKHKILMRLDSWWVLMVRYHGYRAIRMRGIDDDGWAVSRIVDLTSSSPGYSRGNSRLMSSPGHSFPFKRLFGNLCQKMKNKSQLLFQSLCTVWHDTIFWLDFTVWIYSYYCNQLLTLISSFVCNPPIAPS